MYENNHPFVYVEYTGTALTLCRLHEGKEDRLEICLKHTHEKCDPHVCTCLTQHVDHVRLHPGIVSIFWGRRRDNHLFNSVIHVDRTSATSFCMRQHPGACHRARCGYLQDPVDSITHGNSGIRVLYTTGRSECYDYSTIEKPEPEIEEEMDSIRLPALPCRFTAAISDGNEWGTVCKVCGSRIQGPSAEYITQLHHNVCDEVHRYALHHNI